MTDLDPLDPETAVEMYLTERRTDLSEGTLTNHENYLDRFKEWCSEEGIENLNVLSGRDLHEFRQWRADDGLTQDSLQTQLNTVRQFIWFCESIDAAEQGLGEKMLIPSRTGESRDEKLESEEAEAILDYLDRFEYGTRDHAIFLTMWHTGARMGAVQSLDVSDFDEDGPLLLFEHRPEEGTTLKNGEDGKRHVVLAEEVAEVLKGYIKHRRLPKTDEYGREPLFTTRNGRISKNTIQQTPYRLTRPCVYQGECPHDRDQEECEGTSHHGASSCPSSVSPHPIRRGSITWWLIQSPQEVVSDRCDVSHSVLDEHYDRRTSREKMEQRRKILDL